MAKLWRFLSVPVVVAVCLGLMMVPRVPLSNKVALAAGNVTIAVVPSTTTVVSNGTFNVEVVIDNPDGNDIYGCQARLDFDSSYFNVTNITNGLTLTELVWSQYDNAAGTIDHDCNMPTPPGTPTNATSIVVCNISCQALALEGMSTIDFVYQHSPPFRQTMVTYGATDYLEAGNMSLMHSGTVKIGLPKLTVNVTPALKGNVTIDAVTPSSYPNTTNRSWDEVVNLTAVVSVPNWTFTWWSGDLTGSTNPTNITMNDSKNVTANFAPNRTLTMAVNGNGTTTPAVGSHIYGNGMVVNISASPDPSWQFVNWTTANMIEIANATAASTTVIVDENKTVIANFAEITAATLVGHVSFPPARVGGLVEPFVVKLFGAGNLSHVIWTGNATTNSSGVFNITGLDPGTYDIGIKNATCVSEVNSSVTLTAGETKVVNFTIREGDVHSDDYVDMVDYGDFSYAYETLPGDDKWNANADLDRNGFIDMGDYSMFSYNYEEQGDAYGYF